MNHLEFMTLFIKDFTVKDPHLLCNEFKDKNYCLMAKDNNIYMIQNKKRSNYYYLIIILPYNY